MAPWAPFLIIIAIFDQLNFISDFIVISAFIASFKDTLNGLLKSPAHLNIKFALILSLLGEACTFR